MSNIKALPVKELDVDRSKLPSDLGGKKYTFGSRSDAIPFDNKRLSEFRRLVKKDEPQPELYCFHSSIGKSPGVKLGPLRTHVSVNKSFGPGPGSHDPLETFNVPTHIMKRPKEEFRSASTAPGPGSYFLDNYMDNLMNFLHPPLAKSMGRNCPSIRKAASKDFPGPGTYYPNSIRRITGPKIMSKTTTQLRPTEKEPQMNLRETKPRERKSAKTKVNNGTFGKSLRSELAAKTVTPGPDAYQRIDNDWQQSRKSAEMNRETCTFGVKTMKFFQTNKNPAPNTYVYETASNGFSYSIGKAKRKGYQAPIYNENYYDIKNLYPGPNVTIGNEKRESTAAKSKYPGPGTYNIPGAVGVIPPYLLPPEDV